MAESDSDIDKAVAYLPEQSLKRIDEAFDRAVSESRIEDDNQRPRKRRRFSQHAYVEPELAGGFVLDDNDNSNSVTSNDAEDDGGGSVVEDEEVNEDAFSSMQPTHIPLSLIPRALQLLDLDPSDAQVLSAFNNAASSWSTEGNKCMSSSHIADLLGADKDEPEFEQVVSRRDWRAVCAALIPTSRPTSSPLTSVEESNTKYRSALGEETDSSSSAVVSDDLPGSDLSEDEYIPPTKSKNRARGQQSRPSQPKHRKTRKITAEIASTTFGDVPLPRLTTRQMKETLAAFSLFFPSQPKGIRTNLNEDELSKKKLTIKDVANAAATIKEKITAEEIIDMLTFFSSSSPHRDPSMTFEEFQQMMIAARLA